MDQESQATRTLSNGGALLLLGLTAALLFFRLGAVPLLGPDEPRYARVAVEMSRSGDLVTPTLQGRPWLEKPVLYYWLAGAAFRLFGENEAAARLPAVLSMLLLVLATATLGARLYGRRAGLHAGFVAATGILAFAYGRAASMDMLLAATLTIGMALLGLRVLGIAGAPAVPAGALFLGLATLAKGPIGLLLPALVFGAYALATRGGKIVGRLLTPGAATAFLVVAAPWYALIYRAQGRAFIDTFILNHNVARFTSTVHHHAGSIFYYLPVLLVGLFPWSGLLLPAVGRFRRSSSADLLLACWVIAPLVFFSLAGSKLPGYILPVIPPLAVLMGRAAAVLVDREPLPAGLGPSAVSLVAFLLGFGILGGAAWQQWKGAVDARLLLPPAIWAAVAGWLAFRVAARSAAESLRSLRVGAAGFLLLAAFSAPDLLARRESGRDLFRPAAGREVLAWHAWRTAWMAGYFYNDGHVREVMDPGEIVEAAHRGPTLVLCGPDERLLLDSTPGILTKPLASGPRRMVLLEASDRRPARVIPSSLSSERHAPH